MSIHRHWGRWLLLGTLAGLYLWGRRLRPAKRQASVEAIDLPEVTTSWTRAGKLPHLRAMRDRIARHVVRGQAHLRVLDVGCGAGELALLLARRPEVREVVGIDLSGELLAAARETAEEHGAARARFLQMDAAQMPLPDAAFDLVVSTLTLHHFSDPVAVLREMRRVLAPGGRLYLLDLRRDAPPLFLGFVALLARTIVPPALRETGEPIASFQAAYTPCETVLLAAKAGWSAPRVTSGFFWQVLEATRNGEE